MTIQDKLNRLAKAANALRTAADALEQIAGDKSNGRYLCGDAEHVRNEILELLSTDDGESGLDALIRKVNQRLENG